MNHEINYQNVSRETFNEIHEQYLNKQKEYNNYISSLRWWNQRINLFSRSITEDDLINHIHHSLLLTTIPSFKDFEIFIDAGTGGGLPGIPLAIMYPNKKFILNDIIHKKIIAVQQIARNLNIFNVSTSADSISKIKEPNNVYTIISKHAFKINELLKLTANLNWSNIYLLKGNTFENELKDINNSLHIDAFSLESSNINPFYKDKYMLSISHN